MTYWRVRPEPIHLEPARIGEWLLPIVGAFVQVCCAAQKCENGDFHCRKRNYPLVASTRVTRVPNRNSAIAASAKTAATSNGMAGIWASAPGP